MTEVMVWLLTGYLTVMNLLGFLFMGMDKQRAKRKKWRIPERVLIIIAFLGGGIGSLLGMYAFRHKTRHLKFLILLPLSALLLTALIFVLTINIT